MGPFFTCNDLAIGFPWYIHLSQYLRELNQSLAFLYEIKSER